MSLFSKIKQLPSLLQGTIKAAVLLLVIVVVWFTYSVMPSKPDADYTINYPVVKGMSFNAVLKDLEKSGIIRSYTAAKIVQNLFFMSLKQGEYTISPNMSLIQIMNLFHKGQISLFAITFPEGFSIQEISARLQKNGFNNANDFIEMAHNKEILEKYSIPADSVEGFLFPSTYHIPKHITGKEMVNLMIQTFMNKTKDLRAGKSPEEVFKIITLASIVEKEAVVENDRATIASVFSNRIEKNMRLESCATIIYIFEQKGIKKNRVYFKDLQIESPYNTYRNASLPPGPISNAGFNSLKAAFHPADTNYLFFVYKGNGEHFFTDKYEEHMKAYKNYLQFQYVKKN